MFGMLIGLYGNSFRGFLLGIVVTLIFLALLRVAKNFLQPEAGGGWVFPVFLWRVSHELDLTPTQRDHLRHVIGEFRRHMRNFRQERLSYLSEILALFDANELDVNEVRRAVEVQTGATIQLRDPLVQLLSEIHETLTSTQRTRLLEMVRHFINLQSQSLSDDDSPDDSSQVNSETTRPNSTSL